MPANPDSPSHGELLSALDDREGPARRLSEQELEAAVEAVVGRALPVRRVRHGQRRAAIPLLLASLAVTGLAGALVISRRPWAGFAVTTPVPADAITRSSPPRSAPAPRVSERATDTDPRPAPSDAPVASSSSAAERPSARESAADQLKAANQLRRQARWAEAERAYAKLASQFAGSAQGSVAALAAASLRLEQLKDPRGALRLYQSALRAPALSAEAGLGVASCHRALGDRAAEAAALRRLLATHPDSLFRERAERRLAALAAGTP